MFLLKLIKLYVNAYYKRESIPLLNFSFLFTAIEYL